MSFDCSSSCSLVFYNFQSKNKMFEKKNGYINVYSPGAGADNPLRSFFSLTVLFSQYSHSLQVYPFNDCNSFPHSNVQMTQLDLAVK